MGRLQRGARQLLDQLQADLDDIDDLAAIERKAVIFDPAGAAESLSDIRDAVARLRRRLHEDLEPALERHERNGQAAGLPERVADLETQVAELQTQVAQLAAPRVIRLHSNEG